MKVKARNGSKRIEISKKVFELFIRQIGERGEREIEGRKEVVEGEIGVNAAR